MRSLRWRWGVRWALTAGLCAGLCGDAEAEPKVEKAGKEAAAQKARKEAEKKKKEVAAKRQKAAAERQAASAKAINPSKGTALSAEKQRQAKQDEKQKLLDAQYAAKLQSDAPAKLAFALQRGGLATEAMKRHETRLRMLATLQRNILKDERVVAAELTALRSEIALVASVVAEGLTKADGSPAPSLIQKDWLRKQLQEGPLETSDAAEIFQDMTRVLQIKNRLAGEVLAPEARQGLLREMNGLLNAYFEAG